MLRHKYGRMVDMVKRKEKQCIRCNKVFLPTGASQKRCSGCAKEHTKESMKEYHKQRYIRKGYKQGGTSNNNWKGGIATYRNLIEKTACAKCSGEKSLLIHHVDEDRYNNDVSNLQVLCKRCHQIQHKCANNLPPVEEVAEARKIWIKKKSKEVIRDSKGRFKKLS